MDYEMEMEFGKIKQEKELIVIEVNMQMIRNVDKEHLNMLTEHYIMAILLMIRDVDMEKWFGVIKLLIKDIGKRD
jgi:hypothetical protein